MNVIEMKIRIEDLESEKENLIKYIEDKINELNNIICEDNMNRISTTYEEAKKTVYLDLLERIKSGKYE